MEVIKGDKCFETLDLKQYLVFYFGADWCGPCKEAGPKFKELSDFYQKDKIRFFKVDMDDPENSEFINANQVENIPTFIFYKDRNFIERIIGGDFFAIKNIIKDKCGLQPPPDNSGINKTINGVKPNEKKNNVNKQINGVKAPPNQVKKEEPKLEDFYPSETFQGGFEKYDYKNGPKGMGYYLQKAGSLNPPIGKGSGGNGLELHMVYGSWCGHSKRAIPAFEELVKVTDVKTNKNTPVKFVLTEDKSEEMAKFKGVVRGFPTYMIVKPDGSMEKLEGHDRSKDSIINAVKALDY